MIGEHVTLSLWIFEGEEGILPKFKTGFESAHPNITLEITQIPEDLYVTKVDTALAAGAPPDIAYMYERRWLKAGAFLPIDELLASKNIDLARFSQGPLGACRLDGALYCIGSYLGAIVLLYDKQLFDAANIPYPSATEPMSIDEYAALSARLAKPDPDISKRVWGGMAGVPYWWMEPTTLFSEDGRTAIGYVDDEPTIHAWDVLANMARDGTGLTDTDTSAAGIAEDDLLAAHRLAMDLSGGLGDLQEAGIDVGVAPVPVERKGDNVWVPTWTDSWGVTTNSAHPNEAKELVAWIATEGNKVRAASGTLPLDLQVAENSGWMAGNVEREQLLALATAARSLIYPPGVFGTVGSGLEDAFSRIVESGDAATVLRDAAPIAQDDIDQQWQTWDAIQ